MADAPRRTRVYQNHHMDSTLWDALPLRGDDIVIATSYKAGTTWTQAIVAHLLFPDGELPAPVPQLSPWLDSRSSELESKLERLEAQRHRRFIKTHLPLDGLRFDPRLRYVYVARDGRDVFMSLWNHYRNHEDTYFEELNAVPGRVGEPFPRPPEDIHAFWRGWVTRGWFPWESDGWPYWSHLYNVQSWWEHRHHPSILLLHFADLLRDTEGEARRLAAFLGIEVSEDAWPGIVQAVSFQEMKRHGARYAPGGGEFWKGGSDTFLNQGTNGRWRGILDEAELALYDQACERSLSSDCRAWLEQGGAPAG